MSFDKIGKLFEKGKQVAKDIGEKAGSTLSDASDKIGEATKKAAKEVGEKASKFAKDVKVKYDEHKLTSLETVKLQRADFDGKISTKKCKVLITCDNDKKVKVVLKTRLSEICDGFVETIEKTKEKISDIKEKCGSVSYDNENLGVMGKISGKVSVYTGSINEYVKAVKTANDKRVENFKEPIEDIDIDCFLLSSHKNISEDVLKNTKIKLIPAKIVKIHPIEKKLYISATFKDESNDKELAKILEVGFSDYCVGGETVNDLYNKCEELKEAVAEPATVEAPAPVAAPVAAPAPVPEAAPVKAPVEAPVEAPVVAPVAETVVETGITNLEGGRRKKSNKSKKRRFGFDDSNSNDFGICE